MSVVAVSEPLLVGTSAYFTCHYKNKTNKLQVIRTENFPNAYFERVVFPGQQLMFHSVAEAVLEVYTSEVATAMLVARIACERLRCLEPSSNLNCD